MTKWIKEQYEELSQKVADKFYIDAWLQGIGKFHDVWLHDDWERIMELCVKHGISLSHTSDGKGVTVDHPTFPVWMHFAYSEHNNDKSLAERIARMLALMEVQL